MPGIAAVDRVALLAEQLNSLGGLNGEFRSTHKFDLTSLQSPNQTVGGLTRHAGHSLARSPPPLAECRPPARLSVGAVFGIALLNRNSLRPPQLMSVRPSIADRS